MADPDAALIAALHQLADHLEALTDVLARLNGVLDVLVPPQPKHGENGRRDALRGHRDG